MELILWLTVFLVPLLIAPQVLFYFDVTPKVIVLLLGTALLLPWFCVRRATELREFLDRRCGRLFALLLALQGLSLALAAILSTNTARSLFGGSWRRFGAIPQMSILLFALVVAAHVAANPKRSRGLLVALSLGGSLVALYGVLQYFGWDPWIPRSAYHVGEGIWTIVRTPGTLGHADYFATYLLYTVFAGAALALSSPEIFGKTLGLGSSAIASAAIVLSGTRAAILGLLVGGVVLAIWLRATGKTPVSRRSKIVAAGVVTVLLAGTVAFYFSPYGLLLRSRTRWYQEDPWGGARLRLWRDSLGMARRYWVAGAGIDTFTTEFPPFESVRLAQVMPDSYYESPHNFLLDALTSQGVPGLAALLLLCVFGFYAARRIKRAPVTPALAAGSAAGMVSGLFTSFIVPTGMSFYLMLALLAGLAASGKEAGVPPARARAGLTLACASVLAALFLGFVSIHLLEADWNLAAAQQQLGRGDVRGAAASYARTRQWELPGIGADLWYSRSMATASRNLPPLIGIPAWQQGLEAAIRATDTAEDRQNAWYNAAQLYASENNWPRTEDSLRSAIRAAPNWFKPHWILAQVLLAGGRLEEAGAEAKLAADLDGGRDADVARTWDQVRVLLTRKRR